jgi:hypothetical protein
VLVPVLKFKRDQFVVVVRILTATDNTTSTEEEQEEEQKREIGVDSLNNNNKCVC